MKKRYFFNCSYDGSDYSGWQVQPNAPTIQEVIEDRLSRLYSGKKIPIVGCGRTDAGVHAQSSFFHVDLEIKMPLSQLQEKLNKMLPRAIAITSIEEVFSDAHARFDAEERTYRYFIHQEKNPFAVKYSLYVRRPLNFEAMNQAAGYLIGKQDFTSFSKLHTDVNNNFCEVYQAEWRKKESNWYFEITANRFLRNMVRAIVGTLLEVGLEKITPEEMKSIIACKDRSKAGYSVPGKALFLHEVVYPWKMEN